jgi:transcriptional regulator
MSNDRSPVDRGSLLQGSLDLLVLRILSTGSQHGHAISRRIADLSEQWLLVDEGSLYPCLYRMEKKGWVSSAEGRSQNNRKARYYSLTPSGETALTEEQDRWNQFQRVVNRVLEKA